MPVVSGGSQQRRITRKRKPRQSLEEKNRQAFERAEKKLGKESLEAIRESWKALNTGFGQVDAEKGNGLIIGLLDVGLSQIEIRNAINCGGGRIDRMRHRIPAGITYENPERKPPSHAFQKITLAISRMHSQMMMMTKMVTKTKMKMLIPVMMLPLLLLKI